MKFSKKELSFLKLYSILSDTHSFLNDKIYIEFNKTKNLVLFSQLSYKFNFITKIEKDLSSIEKDFSLIIEINQLYQLISSVETEVDITEIGISFNNSKYDLVKYEGDYSIVSKINDIIESQKSSSIFIDEINKMSQLKNYVGAEELNTIVLMDGKFVASNRSDRTGVIKTKNDTKLKFYFPPEFSSIIAFQDLQSIEIKEIIFQEEKLTYFVLENIIIIFNGFEYSIDLDNIFKEETVNLYDHKTKAVIDKNILLESLLRISLVARDNVYNRIFISFDSTNIIVESKDKGYSVEKIPYKSIDESLIGISIVVSVNNLKMMIQSLTGKDVIIKVSNSSDAVAISLEDENNDKFFIHNLYENIEG